MDEMKTMKEEVAGVDAPPPHHGAGDAKMNGNRARTIVDASGVDALCHAPHLPRARRTR